MLRFRQYKKSYGPHPVLNVPELDLAPGMWWIKGGNGAGKSTLLRSVAGLIPYDGDILLDGLSQKKERRSWLAAVNHAEAEPVYPLFLTGHDIIRFYLATKKGNKANLDEWIHAFRLLPFLSHKTGSYSTGTTKKLSLLLAFTGHPKIILLDEPFITLDGEALGYLKFKMDESYKSGISFFYSSHQDPAAGLAGSSLLIQNAEAIIV